MDDNEPVTRGEFRKFMSNDYQHLLQDVKCLMKGLAFIKGQLYVLIPLIMALIAIVAVILKEVL